MYNNSMAAARNLYLALSLIVITNETLELLTCELWNLDRSYNQTYKFQINYFYVLTITGIVSLCILSLHRSNLM